MNYSKQEILEHLLKWEEALLSDKYPQTQRGNLRDDEGFCCLGVACDVSGLGSWENYAPEYPNAWKRFVYTIGDFERDSALLPRPVRDYYGLHGHNPAMQNESGKYAAASYYNDNAGLSFKEIAVLVRDNFIAPLEKELEEEKEDE